jgi:flagellar biosynthesis/type III secretory pathway chaperone
MLNPGLQTSQRSKTARFLCTFGSTVGALGGLAITLLVATPSMATSRATLASQVRRPSAASLPLCYIQMPRQSLQSLDKLCGVLPPTKTIALYGSDGQTPSPALIAAVQKADRALRNVRSQAESFKIQQTLMSQLPISDRARAIQAQQYVLVQSLDAGKNYSAVGDRFMALQQQLDQEPSFQTAEAAIVKAREYMYQQQAKAE